MTETTAKEIFCIVPAAGSGLRFGTDRRKQFHPLRGRPILDFTLDRLLAVPWINGIVVPLPPSELATAPQELSALNHPRVTCVAGGETRQVSVYNALHFLSERLSPTDYVVVHDGVRPFVTAETFLEIHRAVKNNECFTLGIPVTDTVKRVTESGIILDTLDRDTLATIQTPQGAPFGALWTAHEEARARKLAVTDDAAILERAGRRVRVLLGSPRNIKITTPLDLEIAELLVQQ